MSEKKKRSHANDLFGRSLSRDFNKVFEDLEKGTMRGIGYPINVSQTPQGTRVHARLEMTGGVNVLRK